jgi:hypothetical protein
LNKSRQWHPAALATFDVQSKKEDSETKVRAALVAGSVARIFGA